MGLAALHHLLVATLAAVWWQRRRELGRTLSVYLAFCFATVAWSMRGPLWLGGGLPAVALAALWAREAARPGCVMSFARTPRARLVLAALGAVGAFAFPGYSGEFPSFVFAPLGVLVAPTVLLGLSLLVAIDARGARILTLAHVVAGLASGIVEIAAGRASVRGFIMGAILVVMAAVAAAGAAGRLPMLEEEQLPQETSVEQMRARLYQRKTLLPGPRDPRRRGGRFGRRR